MSFAIFSACLLFGSAFLTIFLLTIHEMNFEIINNTIITAIAQSIFNPYDTTALFMKFWSAVGSAVCVFIIIYLKSIKYI